MIRTTRSPHQQIPAVVKNPPRIPIPIRQHDVVAGSANVEATLVAVLRAKNGVFRTRSHQATGTLIHR